MRSLLRGFAVIAVFLAGSCALAAEGVDITPDVVYGHKHGMALTLDVFKPEHGANGAGVLFMVSGGWFSGWVEPEKAVPLFRPMLEKGFAVFAVRHGSSPKFVIPEVLEDVRRSVRFVRLHAKKYGVDPQRLGVTGGSAGGHLSLMLGTTADDGDPKSPDEVLRVGNRVAAVVAYFPPTDLRSFVDPKSPYYQQFPALRFDASLADDCSPLLQVSSDDAPALMIHGDQDKLVPIEHSEKILEEFKKAQVPGELMVIKGAAHGFGGQDGKRASDALVGWLEKHLLKK